MTGGAGFKEWMMCEFKVDRVYFGSLWLPSNNLYNGCHFWGVALKSTSTITPAGEATSAKLTTVRTPRTAATSQRICFTIMACFRTATSA